MAPSGLRLRADSLLASYRAATTTVRREKKALAEARQKVTDVEEGQVLLQTVAAEVQKKAHDQIAGVVSRCLEAVFDDPYEFQVDFVKKRGKTEARLVFVRNGEEVDPKTGVGGGVLDVAAFALKLSCMMLQKPPVRRVLILDEPFKYVSERRDYRERVRDLLLTLSKEMKVQFVMVTHDQVLEVGKVIELG